MTSTARVRWRLGTAPLVDDPILRQSFVNGSEIDPRIVVTRAGATATRFNASGVLETVPANTARIDYGTYTLTSAGGQDWAATPNPNMLLGPEDFGGSAWGKTASAVSNNAATAPDGTLTADQITEDSANAGHYLVSQSLLVVAGSSYTLSLHVKPSTRTQFALILTSGFNAVANQIAVFTLSGAGSFAVTSGSPTCQIVARSDGWYRISITAVADTTTAAYCQLRLASGGAITYQGSGGEGGLYIWGAKMEVGTTATGYQPQTPACRGLLSEPTRTNSIRNPRCEGVVAGSPGTLPTNWSSTASAGPVNGISRQVVGSGIEDGIPYVDLRFWGTPTAGSQYVDVTLETTSPAAAAGQAWAMSVFLRVIAGSVAGLSPQLIAYGTPGFSDNGNASFSSVSGSPLRQQRFLLAKTFSDAGVTGISPRVTLTFPAGQAGDVTLRIGLPQCELGARASSPILPPVGVPAASTRGNDWPTVALTSLPGWTPAEWTLVVEHQITAATSGQVVAGIGSTFAASAYLSYGAVAPLGWGAGYGSASFPSTPASLGVHRNAVAMSGTSALVSADGAAALTVTGIAPPSGATTLALGNAPWSASNAVGGYIRDVALYPRRRSTAQLQALTGPEASPIVGDVLDTGWMDAKVAEGYWSTLHLLGADTTAQYARVDIDDPARATAAVNGQSPGDLIVGRMVAMPVIQPMRNISYPYNERHVPMDTKQRGRRSGAVSVDPGPSYREISFGYEALGPEDARGTFKEFLRRVGIREQIVFVPDPGSIYQPTEAILGRRAESTPLTWAQFAMWSHQMTIEEDPALGA
ncbi:hypothetical protein GAY30_05225 [Azospirillum brasilense]|nr:hypothetical protein [Azospirillum brasilense]NUB34110.1 hypothetical protein [Azospirillum brasilense]RIW01018.1 hypothetical protein D2T81_19515 [Azospirillum brasilense]